MKYLLSKKMLNLLSVMSVFVDVYLSKYTTTNIRINTLHNFCNHNLHPF